MTYGLSLTRQVQNFLISFGFGFLLGIVYDLFFVVRNLISKKKAVAIICDTLFILLASLLSFLLLLVITDGQIRGYILLGELLGFLIYYFSLGVFVVKLLEEAVSIIKKILLFFKRIFIAIFKVISYPFRVVFSFFSNIFRRIHEKTRIFLKKTAKKSKYHLKVDSTLLYNQKVYRGSMRKNNPNKKGRRKYRGKNAGKKE